MNANELIELLDKNAGDGDTPLRQAVTLLRQQQAEIEALKAENEELSNLCFEFGILRKAQEQ